MQLLEISASIGSKSQNLAATAVRSEEQMSFVCFCSFFFRLSSLPLTAGRVVFVFLLLSGVHVARLLFNTAPVGPLKRLRLLHLRRF